jgi:acyl-CoA thioesterase II
VAQSGQEVLTAIVSFHRREPGPRYQTPVQVPPLEATGHDPTGSRRDWEAGAEVLVVKGEAMAEGAAWPEVVRYWARLPFHDAHDAVTSSCGVTFMSDMRAGGAAMEAAGVPPTRLGMVASLDHAIWFHQAADLRDWLLFTVRPVASAESRGLVLGTVHDRHGTHVASFTQEVLVREPR